MESKGIRTLKRFLAILKYEKHEIGSIYFYAILSGLVQLTVPLGIQSIISFVLAGSFSTSLVLLMILVMFGVFFGGLLQINQMKITEKIQQQIFLRYSFSYAHTIPNLDLKKVDGYYLPELVNRFFDTVSLQKGISKLLLDTPAATIQIVFGLLLLSFYHPAFIVFGVILIGLLYVILSSTGKDAMASSIEESDYKYKVAGYLEEMARVVTTFKFSKSSSLHIKKTDSYLSGYLNARTKHFKILLFQYKTLIGFKVLITALMLIVGALLLIDQQLNIGQFVSTEIVIIMVINSVEKLIVNLDNIYDVFTSLEKVAKIIDKPKEPTGEMEMIDDGKGLSVDVQHLTFGYDDEQGVLKDISFNVAKGEKVCITGPGSSGKSTLLRLLTGAYADYEGVILVNDNSVLNYKSESVRDRMGIMLNLQSIFYGTLLENLTIGNENIPMDKIEQLCQMVGLKAYINKHKDGYGMLLHPAGDHLPGKVIKKILLVRALVHHPQLLLLEEPFEGLDDEARERLENYLFYELKNTTAIVITNDITLHGKFDRIITIRNGNMV